MPDDWCFWNACGSTEEQRSDPTRVRRCLGLDRICQTDAVCTLPGICVPEDRCVTDDGCPEDRACVGGRCLSDTELAGLPLPIHWGYIASYNLVPEAYAGGECFAQGLWGTHSELSEGIERDRVSVYRDNGWISNLRPEAFDDFVSNDELTQLIGLTPLDDGTFLLQIFAATNDGDDDGAPDQDVATRRAGDGVFYISEDDLERGRERALRVDQIGDTIHARHATPLPLRMPLLPHARPQDGVRDYTLENASIDGTLLLNEHGLRTLPHALLVDDTTLSVGSLMLGGAFPFHDMAPFMAELSEDCGCDLVGDDPFLSPEGYHSTSRGLCLLELPDDVVCEDASERPYWCVPQEVCGLDGPALVAGPGECDVRRIGSSYRDAFSACFMPEIVPATVVIR